MGDINFKAKMTNNTVFKMLLLKGEAGNNIESIAKTATSGVVDTYTITLTDGTTTTFTVTNGSNIASIAKTATSVLTDTYTVTLTSGETSTFEVTNGRGITSIDITDSDNYVDTYTITYNDGTTSTFTVTNGQDYTIPTGAIVAIDDSLPTPDGYEEASNPFSFDTTPTSGSGNGVTSGGVYDALALKQDSLSFDSTPTSGSNNPITSGGVYDALAGKLDKAGGTMTGNLQVTRSGANARLSVGNLNDNDYVGWLEQYRGGYKTEVVPIRLTADRTLYYPDASGTIALTSDLVTEDLDKSITLAGSATATASFALTVPSGYSIASVTVWTSSSACAAQMSTLSGSVAIARVTNYSAASNTVTVYCRVLYMKS